VYRDGDPEPPPAVVEQATDATRLRFSNGTRVAIRTSDRGTVHLDDVTFDGAAAAISGDAVLLLGGTRLERGGKPLFWADKPITAVFAPNDFNVSCSDDTSVQVRIPGKLRVCDARGRELPNWQCAVRSDTAQLWLEPSFYALKIK
jgi:hypothetical protein